MATSQFFYLRKTRFASGGVLDGAFRFEDAGVRALRS